MEVIYRGSLSGEGPRINVWPPNNCPQPAGSVSMKVVSFVRNGKASYGVVSGDGIVDIASRLGAKYPDLAAVLKAGALKEVEAAAKGGAAIAAVR